MNARQPIITVEAALYGLIFITALALRLINLGGLPLNDYEAANALNVLRWQRDPALGVIAGTISPAYFFFTHLAFFLFSASDAAARLGPALLGSLLVLAPALARPHLGRGGALAASGVLAVASTLVAASRSADGAMLAVIGLTFGLGGLWVYVRGGRMAWLVGGAAALGVFLSAGESAVVGLLALAATALVLALTQPGMRDDWRAAWARVGEARPAFTVALLLSLLLVSTVFFRHLRGLGALADSWAAGFAGFVPGAGGREAGLLLLFLIAYEPLIVVFGLIGAWRALQGQNVLGQALAWFGLTALAISLLYSGREVADLVWTSAPLAVLAGWAVYELLVELWTPRDWPLVAAQVGITVALLVFAFLNVATYAEYARTGRVDQAVYQIIIAGQTLSIPTLAQVAVAGLAVSLAFVIAYLFALGWSATAAYLGLVLSFAGALLAMTIGAGYGVTQLRADSPAEVWWEAPASRDVRRLMSTLGDVSNYTVGNAHDIEVLVQAPPNGLLAWALRDFPHAMFVESLAPEMNSPVVITPIDQQNPTLGSSYVGQDFATHARWIPRMSVPQWVGWLAYRRAPTVQTTPVILWVRQDVQQLRSTGN